MNIPVIFDTSGVISLIIKSDSNNRKACHFSDAIHKASRQVILRAEVCTETLNIIGKKIGKDLQILIGVILSKNVQFIMVDTVPSIRDAAFERLQVQADSVSFTDCLVMAFADHFDTKSIFGFDKAFKKNGYILPE